MSIFSTILEKLGLGKKTSTTGSVVKTTSGRVATSIPRTSAASGAAVSAVDVAKKLDDLASKWKGEKLDWKVSIVDLLKLLGIDSSQTNRKALATELGCPADLMKRLGFHEYLAAQDRHAETGRQWWQCSQGTALIQIIN